MDNEFQSQSPATPEAEGAKSAKIRISIDRKKLILLVLGLGLAAAVFSLRGLVIAATVNGQAISRFAVVGELEETSGAQVLDALIVDKLIAIEGRKQGIVISAEEVDEEITTIEAQFSGQDGTLDEALAVQGMTREELRQEIVKQKIVEKLLGDKTAVSEADVDAYIAENSAEIPEGQEAEFRVQIADELKTQEFNQEAGSLLDALRAQARIRYFVKY